MISVKVLYSALLGGCTEFQGKANIKFEDETGGLSTHFLEYGMADNEILKCYLIHGTLTRRRNLLSIHRRK